MGASPIDDDNNNALDLESFSSVSAGVAAPVNNRDYANLQMPGSKKMHRRNSQIFVIRKGGQSQEIFHAREGFSSSSGHGIFLGRYENIGQKHF